MAAGMVLASISFGMASLVQTRIEQHEASYFSHYNTTDISGVDDVSGGGGGGNSRPSLEQEQISILWLIPQYVVMTAGEILFSVTGLEFAFREAPDSMKSVVTSCWLLTTAVGNLLTVCLNICLFNIYMFLLTCFFVKV
jgi:dipeptide/tripeptide permease